MYANVIAVAGVTIKVYRYIIYKTFKVLTFVGACATVTGSVRATSAGSHATTLGAASIYVIEFNCFIT